MSPWLQHLFGIEPFSASTSAAADTIRFGFATAVPPWAWAIAVLFAALIAGWSYWHLSGHRGGRSALAVLRALTILTILLLAAGPQFVRQTERTERDWVIVMADRSRSMLIADAPGPNTTPTSPRVTRESQLRAALLQSQPTLNQIARDHNVLWLGFDAGAFPLKSTSLTPTSPTSPTSTDALIELGTPEGRRTSLGRSLEQALQQVAAKPVSGVVLLSDGRSSDQPPRALLRRLQAEQIPVFTVPLGSPEPLGDYSVAQADAPSKAYLNDIVPVTIEIQRSGGTDPMAANVQLIDDATGLVLDQRRLEGGRLSDPTLHPPQKIGSESRSTTNTPANTPTNTPTNTSDRTSLTLSARPDRVGKSTWSIKIIPDSPDLSLDNNATSINIELADRPIRVAYFDGYPRWEYRYLKSLLVREKSIRSAVMLLSADKQFLQDGSDPLVALPTSLTDWAGIDVVVLGDVRSELFSDEQLQQLRDHIALRGAGLIWIGGPGATPGSYRGRPLADLLPFTPNAAEASRTAGLTDSGVAAWTTPVLATPAPAARRLGLLALGETISSGWPQELSNADFGWSMLRWAQRIPREQLKPSAEVLAWLTPARTTTPDSATSLNAQATPLVLSMRFGAGRVVYIASDELWRWRYGRGETLYERFWLPLLRFAARESLARTGKSAILEATPERAFVEQPVRIVVKLVDQALIDSRGDNRSDNRGDNRSNSTIAARVVPKPSINDSRPAAATLVTLTRESPGLYAGTFLPIEPGQATVELTDPLLTSLGLTATIDIATADDEMRSPQTDHPALATLAQDTGGKTLAPSQLNELPSLLPNRQLRLLGTPEIRTLWDRPIVLIALMLLLTTEWLGRKWIRLA